MFICSYCKHRWENTDEIQHIADYERTCVKCKQIGFVHKLCSVVDSVDPIILQKKKVCVQFTLHFNEQFLPEGSRKYCMRVNSVQYNGYIRYVETMDVIPLLHVQYLPEYNGVYYLYKTQLYKSVNTRELVVQGDYTMPLPIETFVHEIKLRGTKITYNTEEVGVEYWDNYLKKYLVIGNKLYKEVSMPVYQVCTFGLGGNHGGTGLMVSLLGRLDKRRKNERLFEPHDWERGRQKAIQVATARGDTDSAAMFKEKNKPAIEILNVETYRKYVGLK